MMRVPGRKDWNSDKGCEAGSSETQGGWCVNASSVSGVRAATGAGM